MTKHAAALISLSVALLVIAPSVRAAESDATSTSELPKEGALTSSSHFHLLKMRCEHEESDELDTTPQSPPLVVDDPGTPGCNKWEVNLVIDADLAGNQQNWELPLIDLNYGIGDNLQLKYEVPMQSSTTDGSSKTVVGNSKAGVKLKFFEDEEAKLELALYPQIEFATPRQSSNTDDPQDTGTITTVPLLISKKVGSVARGDVNMTANLAYSSSTMRDERDSVSAALGLGMPLPGRFVSMAEVTAERALQADDEGTRSSLLKLDVGIMREVTKGMIVFGSVGRSLSSSDDKNHTYVLTGLKL